MRTCARRAEDLDQELEKLRRRADLKEKVADIAGRLADRKRVAIVQETRALHEMMRDRGVVLSIMDVQAVMREPPS